MINSKNPLPQRVGQENDIKNDNKPLFVVSKNESRGQHKQMPGSGMTLKLEKGDNLELLKTLRDNSVDSVVTDGPYGISIMNKKWDYNVPSVEFWQQVYRVLKPGGHVLSFGGTRTYHRMTVNLEDAGFEIRDQIMWIYGQGFPKSYNIGKKVYELSGLSNYEGWGTALKPANEPICLARKPLSEKDNARNVLKWGTAGINIADCKIGNDVIKTQGYGDKGFVATENFEPTTHEGRHPTNIIFDEIAAEMLDEQTGKSPLGASKFFYVAKANAKEKELGLSEFESKSVAGKGQGLNRVCETCGASILKPCKCEKRSFVLPKVKNLHPTVKPVSLMTYLCRLITPKGGTVLDPFMGSGSTGIAALLEGFNFIGFEIEDEYFEIAKARIENYGLYRELTVKPKCQVKIAA